MSDFDFDPTPLVVDDRVEEANEAITAVLAELPYEFNEEDYLNG